MNVVDSSAWLEYLANGPNVDFFAAAVEKASEVIVPTLSPYEVFKRVLQQRGEGDTLQAVAVMAQATVVDLDMGVALSAAKLSIDLKLPMADSIMLATARRYSAVFWTEDAHFDGVQGDEAFSGGCKTGNNTHYIPGETFCLFNKLIHFKFSPIKTKQIIY